MNLIRKDEFLRQKKENADMKSAKQYIKKQIPDFSFFEKDNREFAEYLGWKSSNYEEKMKIIKFL